MEALAQSVPNSSSCEAESEGCRPPREALSHDPEVLRAALIREAAERRRAECRANMQTEIVRLALDLLVREPDIAGFFGALSKTMVEESEGHTCAVWLIDEDLQQCDLWMAYVKDRLFTPSKANAEAGADGDPTAAFPCESMAGHLFGFAPGWIQTIEYDADDPRLPESIRQFGDCMEWGGVIATPLLPRHAQSGLDDRVQPPQLGARGSVVAGHADRGDRPASGAGAAPQPPRRPQSARRAPQGACSKNATASRATSTTTSRRASAAILMQLQAAQREMCSLSPAVARSVETAVELARMHLIEARRSVGALRPQRGQGRETSPRP